MTQQKLIAIALPRRKRLCDGVLDLRRLLLWWMMLASGPALTWGETPQQSAPASAPSSNPSSAPAGKPPSQAMSPDVAMLKQLTLQDLMQVQVSTVSRVNERIDDAPGNVYVYSRDVIQTRGYRSVGDLLQVVPGFSVFHRDLDFVVGVRGLLGNDNDKVGLLINGQNLSGPHEQDFLNGPINLDNVERVEVVVGPSSLFQEANTLAATVNVITKNTEGVELISGVGNDLHYSETLMAGHEWEKDRFINFSFSTEAMKGFNAWKPNFPLGHPEHSETGQSEWPTYFGIVNGQYGEVYAQAVAYRANWPELHINSGSALNHGQMTEEKYSLFLKNEHEWTPTLTSVARIEASLKGQTRLNDKGFPVNAVQQSVKEWDYAAEFGFRFTGFEHQLIQAGVQTEIDNNFDTFFSYNSPGHPIGTTSSDFYPPTTLIAGDTYGIGFYVDDEYRFSDQWKIVGGVRVDENSKLHGDRWIPGWRTGVIYEPTKYWISKIIYNRAVRMPSNLEALNQVWGSSHPLRAPFFANTSPQAQNPEKLSTVELDNIFYVGKVRLGANIYHQELQDFITWFAPHSNGGNLRGNGVELNFQAPLTDILTLWANGAWNDSKLNLFNNKLFGPNINAGAAGTEAIHSYVDTHGRIIGSPEYTANVGADYHIFRNLIFSPTLRYFTNQAAAVDNSRDTILRNRFYVDATLSWINIADKNIDMRLSGYNLLNNREPVGSPFNGDTYRPRGLSFVLSLDLRF
jgi:outer membrane receptor protein involved in Fe transport